ncbi:FadR/GntR family transcriptional regulator [Methylobrevis pamukkalensis]|uniref:Pyruvate dehydrogenase complex repressor n=1 Tax=Methylobrevis pamukkalensis TaxID=1439726 RepID=A0A1E3H5W1_9HYPH|nr:FadR/GntR family transcriptional regulator [Methylobrevis pamukkalensis]ODN71702.1 Pyruvate dehydrogenase complex repressor [Methylobrevis pamukkalensis]
MPFHPVTHDRTAATVARQIEGLILDGVLRSGDRLPAERDLAGRLDVSRPILREALADLEARSLIVARHGEGTFVADVTGQVFNQAIVDLIRETPKALTDYLEFRVEMDALAADMAARRATSADRAIIGGILQAMADAHEAADATREALLDLDFHMAISDCTHNVVMIHTLRACYRLLADEMFYSRALLYESPASRLRLYEQHRRIGEAILAGDAEGAARAASHHMVYVRSEVEERLLAAEREKVAGMRLSRSESIGDRPTPGRRARPAPRPPGATRLRGTP